METEPTKRPGEHHRTCRLEVFRSIFARFESDAYDGYTYATDGGGQRFDRSDSEAPVQGFPLLRASSISAMKDFSEKAFLGCQTGAASDLRAPAVRRLWRYDRSGSGSRTGVFIVAGGAIPGMKGAFASLGQLSPLPRAFGRLPQGRLLCQSTLGQARPRRRSCRASSTTCTAAFEGNPPASPPMSPDGRAA